jgi:hypothetical protein
MGVGRLSANGCRTVTVTLYTEYLFCLIVANRTAVSMQKTNPRGSAIFYRNV